MTAYTYTQEAVRLSVISSPSQNGSEQSKESIPMSENLSPSWQAIQAYRKQMEHIHQSVNTDRTGWTLRQWTNDAHQQFHDLDGTVLSMVNGHITALFREIDLLEHALSHCVDTAGFGHIATAIDRVRNTPLAPYTPITECFRK
jgi:hypothetical protein